MSAENPLALVVEEYQRASTIRDEAVRELKAEIARVEAEFLAVMSAAVKDAHKRGVSRYMVQKATGLPQTEVAAWFGNLPNAKPGRRKKDDPMYAAMREVLDEAAPEFADEQSADSAPGGWRFSEPRSTGVETAISAASPEGVAYTVLLTDQGDVAWLDAESRELSLDDRLAQIPDEVEAYVREADWA